VIVIDLPDNQASKGFTTSISGTDGKTILSLPYSRETNVSMLPSGFYIVQVNNSAGTPIGRSKLIINR